MPHLVRNTERQPTKQARMGRGPETMLSWEVPEMSRRFCWIPVWSVPAHETGSANQRNGESSSIPNELGLRRIILRLGSLGDLQQQAGRCTACHAFCQTMSFRGNTKAAANIYLTLSPEEGEWGFAVQLSTDLPGRHPSDSPMEKKKTKKKTKKKLQLNAYETKKPNNPLQRVFSEQWNQMRKMMNPTFLFKNIRFLRLPWAQTGKNIN